MTVLVPQFLQAKTYDAIRLRTAIQDITGLTEGIVGTGDLAVTQRAAGANMSVDVAVGACWVQGDDVTRQGLYHCYNDAAVNLSVNSNSSGSTRTDTVVMHVYDSAAGAIADQALLEIVQGTPGAGAPTIGNTQMPIANITVANGAASIVNANIADLRVYSATSFVREPAMPRAAVWHSVDQSVGSGTTVPGLRLAFNSHRYDTGGFHSDSTNNSRLTIPQSGFYLVEFHGRWAASSLGERRADIFINGTTTSLQTSVFAAGAAGSNQRSHLLVIQRPFVAGDYVEVGVQQDSGGALSLQSLASEISPEFRIAQLSA